MSVHCIVGVQLPPWRLLELLHDLHEIPLTSIASNPNFRRPPGQLASLKSSHRAFLEGSPPPIPPGLATLERVLDYFLGRCVAGIIRISLDSSTLNQWCTRRTATSPLTTVSIHSRCPLLMECLDVTSQIVMARLTFHKKAGWVHYSIYISFSILE